MSPALLIGQLLQATGEIRGRKKLQKIVHLLQTVMNAPFGYSFQFSFYGPYSADLRADVEALGNQGLLLETKEGSDNGSKLPFVYTAAQEMTDLLEVVAPLSSVQWCQFAQQLNQRSAEDLEGISTVAFLKKVGWADQDLHDQFTLLKPRLASNFGIYSAELTKLHEQYSVV